MSLQLLIVCGISDLFLVIFTAFFIRRRYGWGVTAGLLSAEFLLLLFVDILRWRMSMQGHSCRFVIFIAAAAGVAGTLAVSEYRDSRAVFTAFLAGTYIMFGILTAKTLLAVHMGLAVVVSAGIGIHVLLLYLMVHFLLPHYRSQQAVRRTEWGILTLILAMLYGGMYLLYDCMKRPDVTAFHNLMPLAYLLTVYILVILAFQMLSRMNTREMEERERKVLQASMEALKIEVGELHRAERRIAEYNHDSRHFVRMLQGMMADQDYQGVEKALAEMQSTSLGGVKCFCRNLPLNGVVVYYTRLAQERSVQIEVDLEELPEDLGENGWEFAMVAGYLLDKAVQTASEVDTPEGRRIWICGRESGGRILFEIHNTYPGIIEFDSRTNLPASDGRERPGLGMDSVERAMRQWNGTLECGVDGRWFYVTLSL